MKTAVVLLAIATLAALGFAPPEKGSCCADKQKTSAVQKSGCTACASSKQGTRKVECCGKDPFIMEANRMIAASEGRKSTGCACLDKANAEKQKSKKQAQKSKSSQPAKK